MEKRGNYLTSYIWTSPGMNRHEIRLLAFPQYIGLASSFMVQRKGTKMTPHSLKNREGKNPKYEAYAHLPVCPTVSGSFHRRKRSVEYCDSALFSITYLFPLLVVQDPEF